MPEYLQPKITYDHHGTPGIWAETIPQAYWGIGYIHGFLRPLQTLLLGAAGRGQLAATLVPRRDLVALDATIHRLDIPSRGRRQAALLPASTRELLRAYLDGLKVGLHRRKKPLELRALFARLPAPNEETIVASFMASAFVGLAQCQERMERALIEAVVEGADTGLLEDMFAPHLQNWRPERYAQLPRTAPLGFAAASLLGRGGGSNAWAVTGQRTLSGKPLLAGDPHLQINMLPSIFCEIRARVGDNYWLGATIPGLPGMAMGRNRSVAWSATFAVADNVDYTIEDLQNGHLVCGDKRQVPAVREVEIRRRWRRPLRLRFFSSERGCLEHSGNHQDGPHLAVQWSGGEKAAEGLAAYMELPNTKTALEAERVLERAHTLSLHFVIADRSGDVRYCQVGRIPRRTAGWSGLFPAVAGGAARWEGAYEGSDLPRTAAPEGWVASANEGRIAADGGTLSTLAQPDYRLKRILDMLAANREHTPATMQAMQLDLFSRQARELLPRLIEPVTCPALRACLSDWDMRYDVESAGAHAFEILYRTALGALAPVLGGPWLVDKLDHSELGVWWCAAFDQVLKQSTFWDSEHGKLVKQALREVRASPQAWGQVQQLTMLNPVLGALPNWLRLNRGPFPLPGCRATVRQGYCISIDGNPLTVGPAYRFVTDLGDDRAYTSLAGGIGGDPLSNTYDRWVEEWLAGEYHSLAPPDASESV